MQHTGFAVVKALGSPGGVITLGAVMEELPGCAVEHIDALGGVLDGVGVNHIQQDPDAHAVSGVDKIL